MQGYCETLKARGNENYPRHCTLKVANLFVPLFSKLPSFGLNCVCNRYSYNTKQPSKCVAFVIDDIRRIRCNESGSNMFLDHDAGL